MSKTTNYYKTTVSGSLKPTPPPTPPPPSPSLLLSPPPSPPPPPSSPSRQKITDIAVALKPSQYNMLTLSIYYSFSNSKFQEGQPMTGGKVIFDLFYNMTSTGTPQDMLYNYIYYASGEGIYRANSIWTWSNGIPKRSAWTDVVINSSYEPKCVDPPTTGSLPYQYPICNYPLKAPPYTPTPTYSNVAPLNFYFTLDYNSLNKTIEIYYNSKQGPQNSNYVCVIEVLSATNCIIDNTPPPPPPPPPGTQGPQGPAGKDKSSNSALIIGIINLVIIILILLGVGGYILF